ncbi:MAG: alpha-galactosidase [Christensenellales bacterium]|jgi:alpha-galactosidase
MEQLDQWEERILQQQPFSLTYEGAPFSQLGWPCRREQQWRGRTLHRRARYSSAGLSVTLVSEWMADCGALRIYLELVNGGPDDSGIFSEVLPCDLVLPLPEDPPLSPGWAPDERYTLLRHAKGSEERADDFLTLEAYVLPGRPLRLAPKGGRSSSGALPFFNVIKGGEGYLAGIGWTGQWRVEFSREAAGVRVRMGQERTRFRLHPGESVRTPAMTLMRWQDEPSQGHNPWRRMMLAHFSPRGSDGRVLQAPVSNQSWGGMKTAEHIRRIDMLAQRQLPYTTYWIDAGWYGTADGYSPSEFVGDWWTQVGNWQENPVAHPEGLLPIAQAAERAGLDMLLWMETERVIQGTPVTQAHPDWFLRDAGAAGEREAMLLNLGEEAPRSYLIELVADRVKQLNLSCYRQDFNIDPLPFWQQADAPDRVGMTEARYILGLYAFWDALRERFPDLLIDNCASGGRRLDMETAARSIPLWRSDWQCTWNCDPNGTQSQHLGLSKWWPLSSTSAGNRPGDTYSARSSYSAGLAMNYWGYEEFGMRPNHPFDWQRRMMQEYLQVRELVDADFYPLTPCGTDPGGWCAWQYHRPETERGVVQLFRRERSRLDHGSFPLGGVVRGARYTFTDADSGQQWTCGGDQLLEGGLSVTIERPRNSRVIFYHRA